MRKGISTVIATLLMLVITIALAGFAYTYISGTLTARTGVVINLLDATCGSGGAAADSIQVTVLNDGTTASGALTVTATAPDGTTTTGTCTTVSINPGTQGSCPGSGIDRALLAANTAGSYRIRITSPSGTPVTGTVFCSTAGA